MIVVSASRRGCPAFFEVGGIERTARFLVQRLGPAPAAGFRGVGSTEAGDRGESGSEEADFDRSFHSAFLTLGGDCTDEAFQ